MPRVIITEQCLETIEAAAIMPINRDRAQAWKQPDGRWSIILEWETLKRLREHQFEGETLSDCILRIVKLNGGKGLQ